MNIGCQPMRTIIDRDKRETVMVDDGTCNNTPEWRVEYLDGRIRHVCNRHVSQATVISHIQKAERMNEETG